MCVVKLRKLFFSICSALSSLVHRRPEIFKMGQNLQNGAGSIHAKTFTIGSGFSQLLLRLIIIDLL